MKPIIRNFIPCKRPCFESFWNIAFNPSIRVLCVIFCFIFFLFYSQITFCQEVSIQTINSKDGLLTDDIKGIFQDNSGYIWIFSSLGIVRYDGYSLKHYNNDFKNSSIIDITNIKSFCQDRNNNIWMGGSNYPPILFNPLTNEISQLNALKECTTNCLLKVSNNEIWVGSNNGIYKYLIKEDSVHKYSFLNNKDTTFSEISIATVFQDQKKNIWVTSWGKGVYILKLNEDYFKPVKFIDHQANSDKPNYIKSIYQDNQNRIWFSTWGKGIFKVDSIKWENVYGQFLSPFHDTKIGLHQVEKTIQDKNNNLWIIGPYGINILNLETLELVPNQSEFYNLGNISNYNYSNITSDTEQNLWLSTVNKGIIKVNFTNKKFKHILLSNNDIPLNDQYVQSLCKFNKDEILISGLILTFGKYNLKNNKFSGYENFIPQKLSQSITNMVNCFYRDTYGNGWAGIRYNGIVKLYPDFNYSIYNKNSKPAYKNTYVNCFTEDSLSRIWIGSEEGLDLIIQNENNMDEIINLNNLCNKEINKKLIKISDLAIKDNDLWIGTNSTGLFKIPILKKYNKSFPIHNYLDPNQSNIKSINTLFIDKTETLWLGTKFNGLCKYIDSRDSIIFIPNNDFVSVLSIEEDEHTQLWLGTNAGLYKYSLNENNPKLISFHTDEGIQGNVFSKNASCKMDDGTLIFGGNNGLNAFYPENISTDTFAPPMQITNLLVNQNPYPIDTNFILFDYNENNIQIDFVAISYSLQNKIKYKYRLIGYSNDWIHTNYQNRKAVYTNLDAKDYIFEFTATNSSGVWNQNSRKIHFKVKPAPWRTIWAYGIYMLITFLLIYLVFKFLLNQLKLKQALNIEKIEREKSNKVNQFKLQFYANISHELLTPLSIISTAFEQFSNNMALFDNRKEIIFRNVKRLSDHITQLLEFRKIETRNLDISYEYVNINQFVKKIHESFEVLSTQKNIKFDVGCELNMFGSIDTDKTDKILFNILSNAFKYTPVNGQVSLTCHMEKGNPAYIVYTVSDTGIGISQTRLKQIFERFYRIEQSEISGIGIGLAYTKNLVNILNGTINVTSEINKGTCFTIKLPVYESKKVNKETSKTLKIQNKKTVFTGKPETKDITILLLEDNEDFRLLLTEELQNNYKVIAVKDGRSGLNILIETQPDIIISDVMMPIMNGFKFCEKIKKDLKTSHIPVILLTAKTGDENKIEGYSHGADSYLNKPVNYKVLNARILSLLHQKIKLQQYFKTKDSDDSNLPDLIGSLDEKYISQIENIIKSNISNPDFSVKSLEKEMCTSKSMLYRKILHYTALSPSDYIRDFRLKYAKKMLLSKKYSVSEVAYNCGFNSLSHFGLCFKKKYKLPPTEFLNNS